jgi:predicted glycogen debranching enzyme
MSYLNFDKGQLVNLDYSLNREILRSNRAGTYMCTTLNGCNTRKYHGLLVTPVKEFGGEKHVLLSSLDPTIIQRGAEFNLGIHRYEGGYYDPRGHKYFSNIVFGKIPKITFRVGGVLLAIERILVEQEQQIIIKYTLEEASIPTILRLKPFLAFRNIHNLCKANLFVNQKFKKIPNGIRLRLYEGYPYLHLQINKKNEFIPFPDWYYNVEYKKEKNRGYDFLEDLYVPGYFEVPIKMGESVLFSASTQETTTNLLKKTFALECDKRADRDNFLGFLRNASEQFISKKESGCDIIAGFPWYGSITRQTFIALPGLAESTEDPELIGRVLKTYQKFLKDGLFPKSIETKKLSYDSTDSPLWFFWTLQQWHKKEGNSKEIWNEFGRSMRSILSNFKKGVSFNNKMMENGLIYAGKENVALTWMDAYTNEHPVVQRRGLPVEINALWYNAVCFAIEIAEKVNDLKFLNEWEGIPMRIKESFIKVFWKEEVGYLADVVDSNFVDMSVRPNMLITTALDYSPLSKTQNKSVLSICRDQLLTPRGLRTLSPDNPNYKGVIEGNPSERELAVHQGAVYPWLIRFFVEGYLKIHGYGGLPFIKKLLSGFEEELSEHCIGTLSETYNGNPPHKAKGAISQAWNVAAIVAAYKMVIDYEN